MLSHKLQSQRQQQKDCIRRIEQAGHCRDAVHHDHRIIINRRLVKQNCHQNDGQTPEKNNDQTAVTIIKPVNGKCRSAL